MTEATEVPAVFVLKPGDNIGIACRPLAMGETVSVGERGLEALAPVPLGHKIALRAIAAGEKVLRWGVPIGSATRAIDAGEHVHTHNLASDYIPTYTFDGPLRFGERRS